MASTIEKLEIKKNQIENKLMTETLRLHSQINKLGWGAGMRRVKISPSFSKEDRLKERLNEINNKIALLKNHQ